jgi:hypothetical protein
LKVEVEGQLHGIGLYFHGNFLDTAPPVFLPPNFLQEGDPDGNAP